MKWKGFITACVSAAMVAFPQNIISCGGETDPYDYYTSFFHNNLPDAKGYTPFYYVGYNFFYDETEPMPVSKQLSTEWAGYCAVPELDANKFVNKYAWKDLNNLYFNIEKAQPLKIPDSVKRNSMTNYFIQQKDLEALGYLMYAKQVEPHVLGSGDYWEPVQRDSVKMAKLIKNGQQLGAVAKKDLIKLKYNYQVLRLAHYSGRYEDVIKWYDDYNIASNNSSKLMADLCLGLKAGALFRTGKQEEAAYLFSRLFAGGQTKRISNFLGFSWSVKRSEARDRYLQLCKNKKEKADMLALFAMNSVDDELPAMKEIYSIDPSNEALEVLAVREINKLEEKYLSPLISMQPGGKSSYNEWYVSNEPPAASAAQEAKDIYGFFNKLGQSGKTSNDGLFEVAAAYSAYMVKDLSAAKKYISTAEKMSLGQKAKDQLMLTNILVTISSQDKIDGAFEEQLLPSVQWLQQKAKGEKTMTINDWEVNQWASFYRNLMTDVLAKRYHQQNDLQKEALCIGAATIMGLSAWHGGDAIGFMREKFVSKDVEKMFSLMDSKQLNKFESWIIANNSLKKSDVIDFAGTAYLRDYNYAKAIEWFNKVGGAKKSLNKNPFIDLLYDQEERLPQEAKFTTTKLAFTQEMQRLLQQAQSDKVNAGKHYYKYALGLYNITYYGHTWELVEYGRSGSDGYYIPKEASDFQKEYYGAYSALQYFEKAMNASSDKNFRARCLFMMAKCAQKQIHQPKYGDYSGDNYYEKMDADEKAYQAEFKKSKYFPQLVKDYGSTPFYKEAFNSCSYLRDFVRKK